MRRLSNFAILLILISIWVVFTLVNPRFLSKGNISGLLSNVAGTLVIAIGEAFVLLSGGIDLSVGHVAACAIIIALSIRNLESGMLLLLITLIIGTLFGLLNALVVARIGAVPFISTLATGLVGRGVAFTLTKGYALRLPSQMMQFGFESWFGLPALFIVAALVGVIAEFLLTQSKWGRYVLFLGANENALRLCGVNSTVVKSSVYVISGVTSSLGGFIIATNMGAALPGVGDNVLLQAVGGVVLGGIALTGGIGSVWQGMVGVLTLASVVNGLSVWGIQWQDQLVVSGLVLLLGAKLALSYQKA
jgi:ribose transport system permease protein